MFESIVLTMMEGDIFHLFLPWLLVLAVSYGALQKAEFFEEDSITAVTALSISFLSIGGFYLFVPPDLFGHLAAVIGFSVFGFLGLFILLAVVGVDITDFEEAEREFPAIAAASVAVLGVIGVLTYQYNVLDLLPTLDLQTISFEQQVTPILILLLLFGVVVFLTREGGGE